MGNVVPIERETPYVLAVKELVRAVTAVNSGQATIWFDSPQAVRFWREFLIPTKQEGRVRLVRTGFWRSQRGVYNLNGVTFEWDWEEMLHAMRYSNDG